jgi:hypothetical protein
MGDAAVRAYRVVRGVFGVLGRPVAMRALATAAAVGIPSALVFAPSGMRAAVLVHALHGSTLLRVGLWCGWLLLAAPTTRFVFAGAGTTSLRALRLPRAPLLVAVTLLAAMVHVPWIVLFARGGGVLEAWAAGTMAIAIEAAVLAAVARPAPLAVAVAAAAIVAFDLPRSWAALAGTILLPIAVRAGWRSAHERGRSALRVVLRRPTHPILALWAMHVVGLARTARARLSVAAILGAIGGAGLLTLRSEDLERPLQRALVVMALPSVLGAAVTVAPLLDVERRIRPVLRSLRVRSWMVVTAFLLALATPGTALAATAGVAAGWACPSAPAPLAFALAGWAMALSTVVGLWGRRHDRTRDRRAILFHLGVIAIAIAAIGGVLAW